MPNNFRKKYCPICNSKEINLAFELKKSPLSDNFQKTKQLIKQDKLLQLKLLFCKKCTHLFLDTFYSPKISYRKYLYNTKTTVGLKNHYDEYARSIKKIFPKANTPFLEIGSNDGSFLQSMKNNKFNICGVEPVKEISLQANKKSLYTINSFFSKSLNNKIISKLKSYPKIIVANYVFANISNLKTLLNTMKFFLHKDGIIIIQTGYHLRQFEKFMFDYIYHEHFHYFSIKSIDTLSNKCGLKLFDIKENNFKGGSIRLFISHKNNDIFQYRSQVINKYLKDENNASIYKKSYYNNLFKNLEKKKKDLLSFLSNIKKNANVVGFGASHSTTTLLYHFEICNLINYLVDDNPKKINTYSPGMKLKVKNPNSLFGFNDNKKVFLIILSWQHTSTILSKYLSKFKQKGITVIIPLPYLKIIE